jgi:hypothetical protein
MTHGAHGMAGMAPRKEGISAKNRNFGVIQGMSLQSDIKTKK